jgi:hypothetical protein
MEVQLFDTGKSAAVALPPTALARQAGWQQIPEDQTKHKFKGDAVFSNGKLAVVLRQKGRGAEVYAVDSATPIQRAELVAVGGTLATKLSAVKIVENNPGSVTLEATYKTGKGQSLVVGYELKLGQVFVQTQARAGATGMRVLAPCRFAVLPDFFADDMVVDARELAVSETELPSDNFLLHLVEDAIVMAVWHPAKDDVRIALTGQGQNRTINSSEIHYGKDGKIWLAVISGRGTWHQREIAAEDADQILRLDWKSPYTAQWRVDWRRDDKLTDSWEMLAQNPDGNYVKYGWYGQPEAFGNVDWQHEGRRRWTTVLGSFLYPCWVDKDGAGFLQPLKKGVRFLGPAIIYPVNRVDATPLEQFTVVDVMRATMGVGPCEYVLDVEGQKTLDEVITFVRHIRGRIEDYVAFGHEITGYLEEQKQAHPELAGALTKMQETTRRMDGCMARRKDGIKTPEFATQLVTGFRTTLVDYEGTDAVAKCKKITAALVDIGGNQDELVGECRMVVKILRQQAALAMAADPKMAPVAKEIRRRTQQMLRNPTSYEAPRH